MRRPCIAAAGVLVASFVVLSCGCSKTPIESEPGNQVSAEPVAESKGPPSPPVTSQAHEGVVRLADVLASWESGDDDDAVKQIVSIRWDKPNVLANVSVLNLTEDSFARLPYDDQERVMKELMEVSKVSRDLARHVVAVGDKARASGNEEMAATHYEAVRQFGKALSRPERLQGIQLVGRALERMTQDKVSAGKSN